MKKTITFGLLMVSLVFLTGCCTYDYPDYWYGAQCDKMDQKFADIEPVGDCSSRRSYDFETFVCYDKSGKLHQYRTDSFVEQYNPKEKDCKLNKHEKN